MRKTALLWLVLAVIAGGTLFHTSQRVTEGRAELDKITQSLRKEDESLRVLQAEWSYLNQPDRLEKLARKYLHLAPLKGSQFAKADEIEKRLAKEAGGTAEEKGTAPKPASADTLKIRPPQHASPVLEPAPKPARDDGLKTAAEQPRRSFGDVINSLGVR